MCDCGCDGCACGEHCPSCPGSQPRGCSASSNKERRTRPFDEPDDCDPNNPVDLTAADWRRIMADPDYPDDDQEP